MKKIDIFIFYDFGKNLSPLSSISQDTKISPQVLTLYIARNALSPMLDDGSPLLETARRAAKKLLKAINNVLPDDILEAMNVDKDKTFGWSDAHQITSSLKEFETVLGNDAPGISAYLVSQKGIYRTEDLILHADLYFPQEIRSDLPVQAKKDIIEAGKCLAYEVPTACAFHLWRAVETVMNSYYKKLTGRSFSAARVTKNWGKYIEALNRANADTKITQFLDHIRKEYRNPQTHPEAMLEVNEAMGLFGVAMSSIHQMILEMQKP
jgi:hypothetical protein